MSFTANLSASASGFFGGDEGRGRGGLTLDGEHQLPVEKPPVLTFTVGPARCSAFDTITSLPGSSSAPPLLPAPRFYCIFFLVSENATENKNVVRPAASTYALQF